MFNKKEEKTIVKILNMMEEREFAKILKIKVFPITKQLKKIDTDSKGQLIVTGYNFMDAEGNYYIPDDLIPLRIFSTQKLGLNIIEMWVGLRKGFITIPQNLDEVK